MYNTSLKSGKLPNEIAARSRSVYIAKVLSEYNNSILYWTLLLEKQWRNKLELFYDRLTFIPPVQK